MEPKVDGASDAPKAQPRFKIAAKVVMAMQRFQASINPTYNYGKRHNDDAEQDAHLRAAHAQKAMSGHGQDRTASGRTISGRPTSAGQAHGHKGHLLLRSLPEVQTQAQ